jgi:hypothetical protein
MRRVIATAILLATAALSAGAVSASTGATLVAGGSSTNTGVGCCKG